MSGRLGGGGSEVDEEVEVGQLVWEMLMHTTSTPNSQITIIARLSSVQVSLDSVVLVWLGSIILCSLQVEDGVRKALTAATATLVLYSYVRFACRSIYFTFILILFCYTMLFVLKRSR